MNKINPDEPAFPTLNSDKGIQTGLSIRAHIAAMAMQGYISNPAMGSQYHMKEAVEFSLEITDLLIIALSK